MITVEDIEKYLLEGKVEYIKRASIVCRPNVTGYFIHTSDEIHDFFIIDEGVTHYFSHSGSKVLDYNHPYKDRVLYVSPNHVVFDSVGLKV